MRSKTRPFHALVIEDSEDILEDICDRLDSLGHTCDCASTQEQAREHLQRPEGYTYVLLDLEIPVKYGRKSRIQNGRNLLSEIRATSGLEEIPIIVVTSHGKDSPDLAIDVLRHNGADDYITKPFGSNGRSMEQTILDALDKIGRSRPGASKRSKVAKPAQPPIPFEEGELVFYPTHVELCGVKLCGDVHCGSIRGILDQLAQKRPNGKRIFLSGDELGERLDLDRGQKAVAESVRDFRNHAEKVLLKEANVQINRRRDLILNDRTHGYRLSAKLTVIQASDPHDDPQKQAEDGLKPANDPHGESADPLSDPLTDPGRRRRWILDSMRQGNRVRRKHVIDEFDCSASTADRDLRYLRDAGEIAFVGPAKTGYWQLASGRSPR